MHRTFPHLCLFSAAFFLGDAIKDGSTQTFTFIKSNDKDYSNAAILSSYSAGTDDIGQSKRPVSD